MTSVRNILVGCPVAGREWIIEPYLRALQSSLDYAGLDYSFVFLGDVVKDETFVVIDRFMKSHHHQCTLIQSDEDVVTKRAHQWSNVDYVRMVRLRNNILSSVRNVGVDMFLSVDSDILLRKETVSQLVETLTTDPRGYSAVGGKCYMTQRGRNLTSMATIARNGNLHRSDATGVIPVDVIMAIKLMSPAAYNIDYRFERRGEDIGWSLACKEAGLKLGWDARSCNKHCMTQGALDSVDIRVGF